VAGKIFNILYKWCGSPDSEPEVSDRQHTILIRQGTTYTARATKFCNILYKWCGSPDREPAYHSLRKVTTYTSTLCIARFTISCNECCGSPDTNFAEPHRVDEASAQRRLNDAAPAPDLWRKQLKSKNFMHFDAASALARKIMRGLAAPA
jgi:hypothetical protein